MSTGNSPIAALSVHHIRSRAAKHKALLNSRHNLNALNRFSALCGKIGKAEVFVRIESGAAVHCNFDYITVFKGHIICGCAHSLIHQRILVVKEICKVFVMAPELSEIHTCCTAAYGHGVAAHRKGFSAKVIFLKSADKQMQHCGLFKHGAVFLYLIFRKPIGRKVKPFHLYRNHCHKRFFAVFSGNVGPVLRN